MSQLTLMACDKEDSEALSFPVGKWQLESLTIYNNNQQTTVPANTISYLELEFLADGSAILTSRAGGSNYTWTIEGTEVLNLSKGSDAAVWTITDNTSASFTAKVLEADPGIETVAISILELSASAFIQNNKTFDPSKPLSIDYNFEKDE